MFETARSKKKSSTASQELSPLLNTPLTPGLIIVAAAAYLCKPIFFPQVFSHLTTGKWIRTYRELPTINVWTSLGRGEQFQSESWLFDFLLASSEYYWQETGLIVFKLLTFIFFVCAIYILFSRRAKDSFFGILLALSIAAGSLVDGILLPTIFGGALFALTLELVYSLQEGRPKQDNLKNKYYLGWLVLFLLAVLHVNFHWSSVFSVLAGLLSATANSFQGSNRRNFVLKLTALLAFAHLFSPYFGSQVTYALSCFFMNLAMDVQLQQKVGTIYNYGVSFLFLTWLFTALLWHKNPKGLSPAELILPIGASIFGLISTEYISWALISTGVLAALLWGRNQDPTQEGIAEGIRHLKQKLCFIGRKEHFAAVLWVLLCIVIVEVVALIRAPASPLLLPVKEAKFILKNNLSAPLLHPVMAGGYLLYHFSAENGKPQYLPAIDSRLAYALQNEKQQLDNLFEAGVFSEDLKHLQAGSILCPLRSPLFSILQESAEWKIVFFAGKPAEQAIHDKRPPASPYAWAVFERAD